MWQDLNVLVQNFWSICVLRKRPQDLPHSRTLLGATVTAYVLCGIIVSLPTTRTGAAVLIGVLSTTVLAAVTVVLLALGRRLERLNQTLSALLGTGVVLSPGAVLLSLGLHWAQPNGPAAGSIALLWIAFLIWNLLISAHILRHALDVSFAMGVLIAISYAAVVLKVLAHLNALIGVAVA